MSLKDFVQEWKEKDAKQKTFMALGGISLVLALIGVFLPVIPQVPFAIAAAYFFARGSERLHEWTRENKFFGKPVKEWEDHRVVRPKMKIISTVMIIGGAVLGHLNLELGPALILDSIFLASIIFVVTRKSKISRARQRRRSAA